jgi:hypothetical protein
MTSERNIVERLRDQTTDIGYGDRLIIADELEHLRAARLKIEQQSNRIDDLKVEVTRLEAARAMCDARLRKANADIERLREEIKALKNDDWPERL